MERPLAMVRLGTVPTQLDVMDEESKWGDTNECLRLIGLVR